MKRFQFSLQKLLDIREAKELEIKNELAQLLGVQNIERRKQDQLRQTIEAQQQTLQQKMRKGGYGASEIISTERYISLSLRAIDISEVNIEKMEPEITAVRERLIEASLEKKVVEKLKEKKFSEYTYEANREIAKESDDMNQRIYQRRLQEEKTKNDR
ncbi:MAG: flagellar export protein FliJ [bacterium]|nr:flagellar export protein FliJ [bacterium]